MGAFVVWGLRVWCFVVPGGLRKGLRLNRGAGGSLVARVCRAGICCGWLYGVGVVFGFVVVCVRCGVFCFACHFFLFAVGLFGGVACLFVGGQCWLRESL